VEAETRYHPNADQLALASTIEESLAPLLPLSRLHASHVEDVQNLVQPRRYRDLRNQCR